MANLLDSSVWVALFLDFDTQHEKAVRLFRRLRGKIYLPYCVISEVITVLAYKHSKEQADQFIKFIENADGIEFIEDRPQEELTFYKTLKARLSFTDAAIIMFSRDLGVKLISFDKQLARIAKNK